MTLIPPGRVTPALAVEAATVPARGLLCTVVRDPLEGVSITWMTVPTGMFAPSRATVTGFGWLEGTITSGTFCRDPPGDAGAFTPPTDAMRKEGEFGGVIGCGNERLAMFVGEVAPVKPL